MRKTSYPGGKLFIAFLSDETQGYQLCVLNYDFMILDNAFLLHRPGIKTKSDNLSKMQKSKVIAQNTLISKTIMPGSTLPNIYY
jgi:hypothetical protein